MRGPLTPRPYRTGTFGRVPLSRGERECVYFLFDAMNNPSLVPDEIFRAFHFAEMKQSEIASHPKMGLVDKERREPLFSVLKKLERKYRNFVRVARKS